MNCQSCHAEIPSGANFCPHCGDQAHTDPITTKSLIGEVFSSLFGWENTFWRTLRTLFVNPEKVMTTYLNGARKVFMNPFKIYALVLSVLLIIQTTFNDQIMEFMSVLIVDPSSKDMIQSDEGFFQFIQSYPSLTAFLFMPLYAIIAYFVFGKPYNYGEHLAVSFYIYTIIMVVTLPLTIICLALNLPLFYVIIVYAIPFFGYIYGYQRLYKLGFWKMLLKTLKFIGLVLLPFILFAVGLGFYFAVKSKG